MATRPTGKEPRQAARNLPYLRLAKQASEQELKWSHAFVEQYLTTAVRAVSFRSVTFHVVAPSISPRPNPPAGAQRLLSRLSVRHAAAWRAS
jgi:hypothetical protein